MQVLSFFEYLKEMSDTSRALSTETKLGEHLGRHGMTPPGSKTAGFSSKGKDLPVQHSKTKKTFYGEVKDNAKGAKLVSFALKWHKDKKRWDIPDEKRQERPRAAAEFDRATVTHADGTKSSLRDHINKTYGPPEVGKHLRSIRSDHTDMTPADANYEDKGIDFIHIHDKGTFRTGQSRKRDRHRTGLPRLNGTGHWVVASERSRTEYNQREGTGMQVNFRPHQKSIERSNIDISTDEGARTVKRNMLRGKKSIRRKK